MKRFIATVAVGLGLCASATAKPSNPITNSITPEFYNYGFITVTPTVDALSFYNSGTINIDAVAPTATNLQGLLLNGFNPLPFATKDTINFTNAASGVMVAFPGFRFDTATSTTRHSASYFVNEGFVEGLDVPADAGNALFSPPGSTATTIVPALGQPIPSQILVHATNIVNTAAMSVGDDGLLQLTGVNVTNAFGSLSAGFLNTVGDTNYIQDLTGIQGELGDALFNNGPYYNVPSVGVYDLFWGVTNGLTVNVEELGLPDGIPNIVSGSRPVNDVEFLPAIPVNGNAEFSVSAIEYSVNVTNIYYNIIFVNTNMADTNISVTVGFSDFAELQYESTTVPLDDNGVEDIIQFAEPVSDVITGRTVTNGIYVIDDGAYLPTMTESLDASIAGPYNRPNAFEVVTVTPPDWLDADLGEFLGAPYDPTLIYTPGVFNNNKEPFEIAEYGAQIGRNPQDILGSFSSLVTNELDDTVLSEGFINVSLPDPTNDPARIEINAQNLDITKARLRANGMVILNVTNLIGGGTTAVDWGEANVNIGISNGLLNISNIFPTTFQRVRGDVYMSSATWQNTQTNGFGGGTNNPATNQWHYHVLVVDQNLFGTFIPVVRNLTLTGKGSITLQDNVTVINQGTINTTNLAIGSTVHFTQNAQNFLPTTTPSLQNLFVETNAFLIADDLLDVGFNVNQGQTAPGGRKYVVNSITNFGQMIATSPLLEARTIENDGSITAIQNGSILIEASNLFMGLALTNNRTNILTADGSVDLSGVNIQISNSVINAGQVTPAALTLYATAELTDGVSGIPTTNTNSVIVNNWTVTHGFNLPNKPAVGDLYGTQIHTIAAQNFQYVTHVWAGTDWGNNIAKGFTDNEVIGRLVLDEQSSNSILHFSAAGARNAMYVDYLELTNYAITNYRTALSIDPNFVIYFADSNGDPEKLHEVYPNLIWVTNFVGPNSTYVAPYLPAGSGLYCLMNAAVANSTEISFWNGIANFYLVNGVNDGMLPYPYLLNNPNNPLDIIPCNSPQINGTYSFSCDCTPGTNVTQLLLTNLSTSSTETNLSYDVLTVAYNGNGSILNIPTQSQLALGTSYTLKAVPAAGWVFNNWQTAILGNVITSYSNVLTFAFVSNTVVTANFIPNPFPELQGQYSGLFFETNGIDAASSGSVSLTVSKTGSFSGKLLMGAVIYTFSSQFTGSGMAQFAAISKVGSLTVTLQLDVTNVIGEIVGDVNGGAWDAALAADLAPTWTKQNPSPLAGAYTMSLPWSTGTDTNDEAGDSYGTGTVSPLGVLTLTGALSDGATFSTSAPVNQSGQWPFYVYSASKQDYVLGWVTVTATNGLSGTNISWVKGPNNGPLYPGGFDSVLQLVGSTWRAPAKGAAPITMASPTVTLSGGNLPEALSIPVTLQKTLSYDATALNLNINSKTGAFSGWFESAAGGKKITMQGVVLQDENSARGFFLGADESGAVLLGSQ